MSTLLKAFFAALFDGVRAFLDARARDQTMRGMGRAEQAAADQKAAREVADEMGVVADAQAENNVVARGDAADVLERLRRPGS